MVAYSFQRQFVLPIRAGVKRQTVRATGKRRHVTPGGTIQLYQGMRTPGCTKIGTAECTKVLPITIRFAHDPDADLYILDGIQVDDTALLDTFAVMDGFLNWRGLRAFWAKHYPRVAEFEGRLIRWEGFVPA